MRQNEAVRLFRGRSLGEKAGEDRRTHAFAIEEEWQSGMLLAEEREERPQIGEPRFQAVEITPPGGEGIIALAAQLRCVGDEPLATELPTERLKVQRRAA